MADNVELRPFTDDDLPFLDRWGADPTAVGPFEWMGFIDPRKRRHRYEKDGFVSADSTVLAVSLADGTPTGTIGFYPRSRGGAAGACFEIGISLLPEFRGRGLGTAALRQLISYLFDYTTANRIEALTDEENVAGQRSVECLGFQREGTLRGCYFHRGKWRNQVLYALLRDDAEARG